MTSTDGFVTDFKKASYLHSFFAFVALFKSSAIVVNFALYRCYTALYAKAMARCVLPTPH